MFQLEKIAWYQEQLHIQCHIFTVKPKKVESIRKCSFTTQPLLCEV